MRIGERQTLEMATAGASEPQQGAATASTITLPASAVWLVGWLLLVAVTFASRPILPVDESRYVTVAWEMWQGDFLVPHLNGAPYSHKPPLLFWLIHLGWWLFGVSDWWPRLVPPLFGLANLALTARLARRLWGRAEEAFAAPLILLGFLPWTFFTTTLTFDMLVSFFVLVAVSGVLEARLGRALAGWAAVAAGLGLGVLTKGPVVLLFIVPPALLAPWWWPRGRGRPRWLRWYLGLAAAVAAGAALALAWALPAAAEGGEEYGRAILLGQTAGRLAGEVPHPEAWWWYLALLPALLFPFALWPDLLRAARRRLARPLEPSLRFCLAWALPAFVLLSAIGSKQVYYLLPLLPAVALLAARASSLLQATPRLGRLAVPMLALLLVGALVTLTPWIARVQRLPHWLSHTAPGPGLVLVAAAVAGLCCYRWRGRPLLVLTAMSMLIFLAVHLGLVALAARDYDLEPVGDFLAFHQEAGHPVAHIGKYHGQYHFAGRLRDPFEIVSTPQGARRWLQQHPGGRVVGTFRGLPPPILGQPDFEHRFRSEMVGVWSLPLPDLTPRASHG